MKRRIITAVLTLIATSMLTSAHAADFGKPVTWDRHSLIFDGRRVVPVMGEVHYSRIPAGEWEQRVSLPVNGSRRCAR